MNNTFSILLFLFFSLSTLSTAQIKFDLGDRTVDPGSSFCQDFQVEDFRNIVTMQFSINWDPSVIRLDSITGLNIPEPQSFQANLALAASGRMPVLWFDPLGNGLSVNDGISLFTLCFTAIGNSGKCTNLDFTSNPLSIDVTDAGSNGQNIGLIAPSTTICLANPLSLFRANITTGDCNNPDANAITVILQGGTFPYTFNWSGPNNFTSGSPVLTMLADGDYHLTITDSSAPPFVLTDTFAIYGDFAPPVVMIAESEKLDCDTDQLTLDASASSSGSIFDYQWMTSLGNIITGDTTSMPLVNASGWYLLEITNTLNGCKADSRVEVKTDTMPPVAQAIAGGIISCTDSIISLSAAGSSSGSDIEYLWTTSNGNIVSGANSETPEVNAAGNYLLLVSNTDNGCSAVTGVVVEENTLIPLAEAGLTEVDCDSLRVFLNVNNSGAAGLSYEWSTNNGNILEGGQTERPRIGQGGNYFLTALDPVSGCTNISEVQVSDALFPFPAVAGESQVSCLPDGVVAAGLPSNALGEWTSPTGGLINSPLADTTTVSNLKAGNNLFIWTLSTNECPDYDSDTLLIWLEGSPVANNDQFSIPFGLSSISFNVALNDSTQRLGGWDIEVINDPVKGALTNKGLGILELTYPFGTIGSTSFRYRICNSICPGFCDEAEVFLTFQANPNIDTTVHISNGITANGDGINDKLIIPEIEKDPAAYPNSELIVFNRWGAVVYQASPYLNDWDGVANNGIILPQGTYYYVLTLEIGSRQVFKGDVTIMK